MKGMFIIKTKVIDTRYICVSEMCRSFWSLNYVSSLRYHTNDQG